MFKDYIVDLKYDEYINNFEMFLRCHNIKYEVLNDLGMFRIYVTPFCASYIRNIYYIDDIIENQNVKADEIKPIETETKPVDSNVQSDDTIEDSAHEYEEIWYRNMTQVTSQWKIGTTGKGVKVAVVDSGIAKHQALNISKLVNLTQNSKTEYDTIGSGTIAAGIIAARDFDKDIKGIAYGCDLYGVKIVEDNRTINLWSMYKAIEWCIDNKIDIVAITTSIRPEYIKDKTILENLQESVKKANERGLTIVSGVGQEGANNVNVPASIEGVFSVTGVKFKSKIVTPFPQNVINLELLPITNSGLVEFSAPGANITTTFLNNTYSSKFQGTGIACAYFAAGCALLMEYEKRTAGEIFEILKESVAKTDHIPFSKGGYGFANYIVAGTDVPG